MPTPWQRDLERDRKQLEEWLARKLTDARDLRISGLRAPESSGFSNDTLLFDLEYTRQGTARRDALVVRIEPTGYQVFPEYDLGLQFRTMQLLGATDVPVPVVHWLETGDRGVLGAPFYVMDQVRGRVPSDRPPYHADGWMLELTPRERREIWLAGFEVMAKLHRLDPAAAGFDFLDRPELGPTPLDQQFTYYRRYLDWASDGRPQPTIESAFAWVEQQRPDDARKGLLWGDARIGNIIFDGTRPAAVLDWEMVALGSPELDVGWAVFLDRHHSEGIETPRLEGFPSYEESVAYYESLSGHAVRNLHYYQVFAGMRFAVIMLRVAQQFVQYGLMDEAAGRAFELDNTVTRLLAKLLELPPPAAA